MLSALRTKIAKWGNPITSFFCDRYSVSPQMSRAAVTFQILANKPETDNKTVEEIEQDRKERYGSFKSSVKSWQAARVINPLRWVQMVLRGVDSLLATGLPSLYSRRSTGTRHDSIVDAYKEAWKNMSVPGKIFFVPRLIIQLPLRAVWSVLANRFTGSVLDSAAVFIETTLADKIQTGFKNLAYFLNSTDHLVKHAKQIDLTEAPQPKLKRKDLRSMRKSKEPNLPDSTDSPLGKPVHPHVDYVVAQQIQPESSVTPAKIVTDIERHSLTH